MRSIIIKLSSALIMQPHYDVWLHNLAKIIAELKTRSYQVCLVTSGATALGKQAYALPHQKSRQFYAILGQPSLFNAYETAFRQSDLAVAQVLIGKDDFRSRSNYLQIRSGLNELLKENIVPLINENDVIADREFAFSDNDEIAGLVASLLGAERLILASSVAGLLDNQKNLIKTVENNDNSWRELVNDKTSAHGRGGMMLKCLAAQRVARRGIPVTICSGLDTDIIFKASLGKPVGTTFFADKHLIAKKRWILDHAQFSQGTISVDKKAAEVMRNKKATSLLMVGVTEITGEFSVQDVISVVDQDGGIIGYGQSQYDAETARDLIGKHADKPLIHYDAYIRSQP
ncbi:glutamate 5-kinase [Candidatus Saccharibacteria bacterium]|jgi:glutamate 5-kinase|nr:glutamate 5-kinase [Candidatus Saccharibacteria bacterium]